MIQEYLTYLEKNLNYSENTIRAYSNDLQGFAKYAKTMGWRWSTLTKQQIDQYVASLHDHYEPKTINRRISSLRSMLQWAMRNSYLPQNPARFVQSQKLASTLPETADREALISYLGTPATSEQSEIIHALIALLLDTGIRLQEAIDIRCEDINVNQRSITIHGKGNKQRIVYFTDRTIEHNIRTANRRKGYLLPIENQQTLRYMMYDELRGITHTHPHAIRHLWATDLIANGASLQAVSALMGHQSVKTTERYTHIANNWVKAQYNKHIN